jgi:hypothetical protein
MGRLQRPTIKKYAFHRAFNDEKHILTSYHIIFRPAAQAQKPRFGQKVAQIGVYIGYSVHKFCLRQHRTIRILQFARRLADHGAPPAR